MIKTSSIENNTNNGENQSPPPSSPSGGNELPPSGEAKPRRGSMHSLLWVLFILLSGIVVGLALFLAIAPHIAIVEQTPFGERFLPVPGSLVAYLAWHIILSTVNIALLVSLVVVYGRTYSQTRARFALGISIVFVALLLESMLSYPLYQLLIGVNPDVWASSSGSSYTLADIFTVVAYTVFLYLSLE